MIFLDIDGTLCGEGDNKPEAAALKKLMQLSKKNEIFLCSNSNNTKRNRLMGKRCGVPYLDTRLQKPNKGIADLIKNKNKKPFMVIGNLFYTDGRFAKNIGAEFIKVKTLLGPNDSWLGRVFYFLDENVIARFV